MLRAISISDGFLYLTTDEGEFRDIDLPDGLLTDYELSQVRAVQPTALPGYSIFQQKTEVPDEPHTP